MHEMLMHGLAMPSQSWVTLLNCLQSRAIYTCLDWAWQEATRQAL